MGHSVTYLMVKSMLESGSLVMALFELVKALSWFEKESLITAEEHNDLLRLASALNSQVSRTNK